MNEDFEKFRRIVLDDLVLQQDLFSIEDREEFIEHVVEQGKQYGLSINEEDVFEEMNNGRRVFIERWI